MPESIEVSKTELSDTTTTEAAFRQSSNYKLDNQSIFYFVSRKIHYQKSSKMFSSIKGS